MSRLVRRPLSKCLLNNRRIGLPMVSVSSIHMRSRSSRPARRTAPPTKMSGRLFSSDSKIVVSGRVAELDGDEMVSVFTFYLSFLFFSFESDLGWIVMI